MNETTIHTQAQVHMAIRWLTCTMTSVIWAFDKGKESVHVLLYGWSHISSNHFNEMGALSFLALVKKKLGVGNGTEWLGVG